MHVHGENLDGHWRLGEIKREHACALRQRKRCTNERNAARNNTRQARNGRQAHHLIIKRAPANEDDAALFVLCCLERRSPGEVTAEKDSS
jgi:hypothetical protein